MRATFNPTAYLLDDAHTGPVEIATGPAAESVHSGEILVRNAAGFLILARYSQLTTTVDLAELPDYAATSRPACVRPALLAAENTTMCGAPATFVAVRTADGWVSGTTWCAGCVTDHDTPGGPFHWHPLAVDATDQPDPSTDGDDVVEYVNHLTAPADPIADLTAERNRHRADADRLAVERDHLRGEVSRLRIELARTLGERDTARRQRDQITEQLDAALDDRDRARAELRTEVESHRRTAERAADADHARRQAAATLRTLVDGDTSGELVLAAIGRCWAGGEHTGAALTAHADGDNRTALHLAARQLLDQVDPAGPPAPARETLGDVAADLLDDDQVDADLDDRAERDYADGFGNAYRSGAVEVQA